MNPHFEDIEAKQDEISYRRITAYELRRLSQEVEEMTEKLNKPRSIPWWLPVFFGVLLTGNAGYIGIVHNQALGNAKRIDVIADEQNRRSFLKEDVADLKRRLLANEGITQQLPYIAGQIVKVEQKVDKLLERYERYDMRQGR